MIKKENMARSDATLIMLSIQTIGDLEDFVRLIHPDGEVTAPNTQVCIFRKPYRLSLILDRRDCCQRRWRLSDWTKAVLSARQNLMATAFFRNLEREAIFKKYGYGGRIITGSYQTWKKGNSHT